MLICEPLPWTCHTGRGIFHLSPVVPSPVRTGQRPHCWERMLSWHICWVRWTCSMCGLQHRTEESSWTRTMHILVIYIISPLSLPLLLSLSLSLFLSLYFLLHLKYLSGVKEWMFWHMSWQHAQTYFCSFSLIMYVYKLKNTFFSTAGKCHSIYNSCNLLPRFSKMSKF